MRTSATNRKVGKLMNEIMTKRLIPKPEFQRRLVWANKHKIAFLQTVLKEFPFPEIYLAIGDLDTATGESKELLVDGQQRMTTLFQYFTGSTELKLPKDILPYAELSQDQKRQFLEYEVVIRDLGAISMDMVKEVFERINSTRYSLTAMEVHNARFEGEFKQLGEELAGHSFFERHVVFSATDIRRMEDLKYCLVILVTLMDDYSNRDDELEEYLKRFNDELPRRTELRTRVLDVFNFLDAANFPDKSRLWKKADFFTAVIEIDRAIKQRKLELVGSRVRDVIEDFYAKLAARGDGVDPDKDVERYYLAALQASNDRLSRVTRGEVLQKLLRNAVHAPDLFNG